MIPKLEQYRSNFKKEGVALPSWLDNADNKSEKELCEEWISVLDRMILSFRMVLNYNTSENSELLFNEDVVQDGLDLFAKYYQNLWD